MKNKMKTTIEEFIKKHKWYYVNSNITTSNFPRPEKVETKNPRLYPITEPISSEKVLDELKSQGLRPANIYELMAWFDSHKDEIQGTGKWYAALGQLWQDPDGYLRVPGVYAYSAGDFFFVLDRFGDDWGSDGVLLCFCDPALRPLDTKPSELRTFGSSGLEKLREKWSELTRHPMGMSFEDMGEWWINEIQHLLDDRDYKYEKE